MAQGKATGRPKSRATASSPAGTASSIVSQIGSNRVQSISLQGSNILVTGEASDPGADTTRTLWYEAVASLAFSQDVQATTVTRDVVDAAGQMIDSEHDPLTPAALPSTVSMSAATLTSGLTSRAPAVDASIKALNYIPLLGGTGEVVVQPTDPSSFVKAASESLGTLIGPMSSNNAPFLVTVIGSDQTPMLVIGHVPGLGGDAGQGVGWQAPGVQSDAIVGDYLPFNETG